MIASFDSRVALAYSCAQRIQHMRMSSVFAAVLLSGAALLAQTKPTVWRQFTGGGISFQYPVWPDVQIRERPAELLNVGIEGPMQPNSDQGCAQEVEDAASLVVEVKPAMSAAALAKWLDQKSSVLGGDTSLIALSQNGFVIRVLVARNSQHRRPWGETGGAYRQLPGGRVVLITWTRWNDDGENDFSYRRYLLPLLSSFQLAAKQTAADSTVVPASHSSAPARG